MINSAVKVLMCLLLLAAIPSTASAVTVYAVVYGQGYVDVYYDNVYVDYATHAHSVGMGVYETSHTHQLIPFANPGYRLNRTSCNTLENVCTIPTGVFNFNAQTPDYYIFEFTPTEPRTITLNKWTGSGIVSVKKNGIAHGELLTSESSEVFQFNQSDTYSFQAIPSAGNEFEKFCKQADCTTAIYSNPYNGSVLNNESLYVFFNTLPTPTPTPTPAPSPTVSPTVTITPQPTGTVDNVQVRIKNLNTTRGTLNLKVNNVTYGGYPTGSENALFTLFRTDTISLNAVPNAGYTLYMFYNPDAQYFTPTNQSLNLSLSSLTYTSNPPYLEIDASWVPVNTIALPPTLNGSERYLIVSMVPGDSSRISLCKSGVCNTYSNSFSIKANVSDMFTISAIPNSGYRFDKICIVSDCRNQSSNLEFTMGSADFTSVGVYTPLIIPDSTPRATPGTQPDNPITPGVNSLWEIIAGFLAGLTPGAQTGLAIMLILGGVLGGASMEGRKFTGIPSIAFGVIAIFISAMLGLISMLWPAAIVALGIAFAVYMVMMGGKK